MNLADFLRQLAPGPVLAIFRGERELALRRWTTPAEDREADAFWRKFEGRPDQLAEERRLITRDRWQHFTADPVTVAAFEAATDHGAQPCRIAIDGERIVAERLSLGGLPAAIAKGVRSLPNRLRVISAAEFCGHPPQPEPWLAI